MTPSPAVIIEGVSSKEAVVDGLRGGWLKSFDDQARA